jgi:hypothetical protein
VLLQLLLVKLRTGCCCVGQLPAVMVSAWYTCSISAATGLHTGGVAPELTQQQKPDVEGTSYRLKRAALCKQLPKIVGESS